MDKIIRTKKELKEWLDYETSRYKTKNLLDRILNISEASLLRHHQILLRKTEYYYNTNKKLNYLVCKVKLGRFQKKYGISIPINTCGKGLQIMHLGSVLINDRVTIGENCIIHINTAVVAGGKNDDVPTIGNGCVISVGAVILGGVDLADSIVIGANAVVNKSFDEPDITIAGVPSKKISNNGRSKWDRTK